MALRNNPFSQRMYLRIWLAVVGCVALLMLVAAWGWKVAQQRNDRVRTITPREVVITRIDEPQPPIRGLSLYIPSDDSGFSLGITTDQGHEYIAKFAPRAGDRPPPRMPSDWELLLLAPPFGYLWLLGLVGLSVVIGVFPIIRHLMKRLETLRLNVQKFGAGDLSVRMPIDGADEVADLAGQFNAAAARIETLVRAHKTLLANASHELRSPLARIRMGLELAETGAGPSHAARQEIQRNIAELDQLIDEILLSSRLDLADDVALATEAVDIIGLAAEEAARVGAELELASPAPESGWTMEVLGEAKLLRRAIRNLLENARRYSEGPVELALHWLPATPARPAAHIAIHVSDRGPGVPAELRQRIFEPFYRAPGASERSGGVGLGLALVHTIAQRHGGSVRCEGREGGGAVFVLTLPALPPQKIT